MLNFNPDSHAYSWRDKSVPGVTSIIREWVKVNIYGTEYYVNSFNAAVVLAEKFESKRDWGNAVHKMCLLYARGSLDETALHDTLLHPLEQFKAWIKMFRPEILHLEEPMYSARYGYAGTPDIVARIRRRLAVVDIKTGYYEMAGPQTAAYEQLHLEEDRKRLSSHNRYVLRLGDDGLFKFKQFFGRDDWQFFLSRLFQEKYIGRAA